MMSISYQEENENYCLLAKIDNVKNIFQLLKAINFKDYATVFCSSNGLKVTVEDSKSVQANAFIQAEMFQKYDIKEDFAAFKISLAALLECLNIFGGISGSGMTTLKMGYNGYGFPLSLVLAEAGMVTDCSLKTQDPDDNLDFNFCNTGVVNKIIAKSECLKDIFSELDMSSEVMEILMSPNPPNFRISTFGNYGPNHFEIPRESDVMESFSCTRTTRHKYKTNLMKFCIKPLTASQKVSIRTDNRGFLCLQFMLKTEDNHICFVEYFCASEEDDEE